MNFSDLKCKDVVNICDGRKLGKPIDLALSVNACVEALIVPGGRGGLISLFKPAGDGIVIPWKRVRQVGDDVILVEIEGNLPN